MTAAEFIRNVVFKKMQEADWVKKMTAEFQQKKATDELFRFRDLPRGSRLDDVSVTAVRQLLENNVASFPEKVKVGFVKFFEGLISHKPPKGMGPITAENFITSTTADILLGGDELQPIDYLYSQKHREQKIPVSIKKITFTGIIYFAKLFGYT